MDIIFESCKLPKKSIKIRGGIKEAIEAYKKRHVPLRLLISNFLAVKAGGNDLIDAENPWAYYYKDLQGYEVESGVSVDETLFRFATMRIKNEKPTDLINAVSYAGKYRNDISFEIGYLIPFFLKAIRKHDSILVVNPSPDIIIEIEGVNHQGKVTYAIVDDTIAQLYRIQFPKSEFITFDQVQHIRNINLCLLVNRDQKPENAEDLLKCVECCSRSQGIVIGLVPSVWFDNSRNRAQDVFEKSGIQLSQMLIVDTGATASTPRKKVLIFASSDQSETITIYNSSFDKRTGQFNVLPDVKEIGSGEFFTSRKSVLSLWKLQDGVEDKLEEEKYRKASEYRFSKEISLFYRIYKGRKNRYAGVAYYRAMIDPDAGQWGKKLSPDIEKGLRSKTEENIRKNLEILAFDEAVYDLIRADIDRVFFAVNKAVSLKTLWHYCWLYLQTIKKYDHAYVSQYMHDALIADYNPAEQSGSEFLRRIANHIKAELEDIPYKTIEQFVIILDCAVRHGLLLNNPLSAYIGDFTRRVSERQQDVRNALVKKHFSEEEELSIIKTFTKTEIIDERPVFKCIVHSLYLATAIRLFTGMAIREVAALEWADYQYMPESDYYTLVITKFVDQKGKILPHADRDNWKRFRIVPISKLLSALITQRKQYLIEKGVDEEYLKTTPMILSEERISDLLKMKTINHIVPSKISKNEKELINKANIPVNNLVLPDDTDSGLVSDFNTYHGDIVLSNFRHRANHKAGLTMGEINYMIGIKPPDTLSEHYIDYSNEMIQAGIVQKLRRWDEQYKRQLQKTKFDSPGIGQNRGSFRFDTGPYNNGTAVIEMIVENGSEKAAELTVECEHGLDVTAAFYSAGRDEQNSDR